MSGSSREATRPAPLVPLPGRLVVLLSGRGSNFDAIAHACEEGLLPARIVLVVSDRPAPGLDRARERRLPTVAVDRKSFPCREEHETAVLAALESARPDLICLAGYMRLLTPAFVNRYPARILNVHPALLPSFPGSHAQRQAVEHGVRVSGATVHFVDAGTDTGPILAQDAVPVLPGDDADRLAARILPLEHRLYVEALGRVLAGGWRVEGRRVLFPSFP